MVGLLNTWKSSILDSDSRLLMTRPALPLCFEYLKEHQNHLLRVRSGRGRAVNEWVHHFESADDDDDDDEGEGEDDHLS